MVLETDELKNIIELSPTLKSFTGFLSVQEVGRLVEILAEVFVKADQEGNGGLADYSSWAKVRKEMIFKELAGSQDLFGMNEMAQRFPADDFLKECYQSMQA